MKLRTDTACLHGRTGMISAGAYAADIPQKSARAFSPFRERLSYQSSGFFFGGYPKRGEARASVAATGHTRPVQPGKLATRMPV